AIGGNGFSDSLRTHWVPLYWSARLPKLAPSRPRNRSRRSNSDAPGGEIELVFDVAWFDNGLWVLTVR
ncbi:MAG TPA: hypothetical protein VFD73_14785, partial [Gemmatimonadales bacterium]|nr:hypothetical protein [Gemmatimonadales bacterium]